MYSDVTVEFMELPKNAANLFQYVIRAKNRLKFVFTSCCASRKIQRFTDKRQDFSFAHRSFSRKCHVPHVPPPRPPHRDDPDCDHCMLMSLKISDKKPYLSRTKKLSGASSGGLGGYNPRRKVKSNFFGDFWHL